MHNVIKNHEKRSIYFGVSDFLFCQLYFFSLKLGKKYNAARCHEKTAACTGCHEKASSVKINQG